MPTDNTTNTALRSGIKLEHRASTYTAAALAQNEIVNMISMYRGEKVVDVALHFDALGANSSLSVGTPDSAARFVGTTTTTSAGRGSLNTGADLGLGYVFSTDGTIDFKVVGSGAITGKVTVVVTFVRTFPDPV